MRAAYVGMMFVAGLSACGPSVPDSGPGGVQDYNSYLQTHSQGGTGSGMPAASDMPAPSQGFSTEGAAAAIAAAEGGTATPTGPQTGALIGSGATPGAPLDPTGQLGTAGQTSNNGQTAGTATSPSAMPPINANACAGRGNAFAGIAETTSEMNYASGGVSDEQDFNAVKSRESIASDAQRIECNREQYVVVQPGALPTRSGAEGPNIAEFALQTTNPPGVKLYSRPPFYLTNPEKACAAFASPDLAQQAFLAAGGPQKDRKALDPDGDGFACSWDPRPFRNAKK